MDHNTHESTLKGGCLCGAVRYEVTGEPKRFYYCHCSRCRKATGTGHAANLFLQPGTLKWLAGRERVVEYKVPEAVRFTNSFCSVCGSRVPRQPPGSDVVMIPAGSLEDPAPIRPEASIFFDSRVEWSCTDVAVPQFPGMPTR